MFEYFKTCDISPNIEKSNEKCSQAHDWNEFHNSNIKKYERIVPGLSSAELVRPEGGPHHGCL